MIVAAPLSHNDITSLLNGTKVTVEVAGWSILLGLVLSFIGGVASLSRFRLARIAARIFIELFRGIAAVILLFWAAFALPLVIGINLTPLQAGVLALGTNMGAYGSEIVRAAIQAVPAGQSEASVALSLTAWQRLRYVTVPQAVRVMLPPFGNLMIELLKGTALVSLITLSDVLDHAQKIRTNDINKSPAVFAAVLIVYFVLSTFLTALVRVAERIASRPYRTAKPRFALLAPFRRGSGITATEEFE